MNFLASLFSIFFMTMVGFYIIKYLKLLDNVTDFRKLPYSFGLGAGFFALQLYSYSRINLGWNIAVLSVPWIIILIFAILKRNISLRFSMKELKITLQERFFLVLIILLMTYVVVEAIIRPVTSWDGWSSWLLRAKMFYIKKGVTADTFTYIPSEYPVLVSLMSTYLYILMGSVDDRMVLLLYPSFYIFLGIMFFNSLKDVIGRKLSLIFTFLLLSTQNIVRHSGRFEAGQADIILGFYAFASVSLAVLYQKTKKLGCLLLLQIFLAITALIKDDGISIAVILEVFLIYSILKSKKYWRIFSVFIWLAPFLEWQYFKATLMLPRLPSYLGEFIRYERIPLIITEFFKEMLSVSNWNFLWPFFFFSLLLFLMFAKRRKEYLFIYLIIIMQMFVYACVFLFTYPDPRYHIPNVINRAFLHIAPVALFAVALNTDIIRRIVKNGKI